MKAKNQRISFKDQKSLFTFKEEVEWMGRYVPSYDLVKLELVVSPFPKNFKKKADAERKLQAKRDANSYDDDEYGNSEY